MRRRIPGSFVLSQTSNSPDHDAPSLRFESTADSSVLEVRVLDSNLVRIQFVPNARCPLPTTHTVRPPTPPGGSADSDVAVLGIPRQGGPESLFPCPRPPVSVTHTPEGAVVASLATSHIELLATVAAGGDLTLTWTSRASGHTFLRDLPFRAYEYDLQPAGVSHYVCQDGDDTVFYGAGERASPLSLAGRSLRLEALDALGYNPERTDPLYKVVPAYYGLSRTSNEAFGVFYDSLATGILDFGSEIDALWGPYTVYRSQAPTLDYYVFYGPSLSHCVHTLASLLGTPALVPKYALGYLASSMGYAEDDNAQALIEAFPQLCDRYDIPCDLLHLSSGYTVSAIDGSRNVFTWNTKRFPDPARMFATLRHAGIRTVANVKPWLLAGHPDHARVAADHGFILDPDTGRPSTTRLWSAGAGETSSGCYIDFSSVAGRAFWKAGVHALLQVGVQGIWNDNNEMTIHDDAHVYSMLGRSPSTATAGTSGRTLQTVLMASASYEAMVEHAPTQRPFLITRSSAPGAHRYASQTWSGDNLSAWHTLKHNIPMGLNAGLSLMPGYGHDVGGFVGPRPEPELFVRWVQNGIFHPRFCIHSWKPEGITEPWMYPDVTHIVRDAIRFRYTLIPLLYTLHHEASAKGSPVIRPLVYEFQHDQRTHTMSFEWMLGSFLLVASVFESGARDRTVYLPKQHSGVTESTSSESWWCNFWTGQWHRGGEEVTVPVPLEQHGALFARAGALIPTGKVMRHVGADKDDARTILVFPPPMPPSQSPTPFASEFTLVDDDGETADAPVFRCTLWMRADDCKVTVGVRMDSAAYQPPYTSMTFVLPFGDARELVSVGEKADGGGNKMVVMGDGRRSISVSF